jgi:hypothetical protein
MIAADPTKLINRYPYQYKVTDESPTAQSDYHRYSVMCFKKNLLNPTYKLVGADMDILAASAEKAVKIYIIKTRIENER